MTLIFAFMPLVAQKLADRDRNSQMFAVTQQLETAQNAARLYVRENAGQLAYDTTVLAGNAFADTLEPYGLPLGFVPRTALGQDIALEIEKTPYLISARLVVAGGKLSGLQRAEMARRLGFYATTTDDAVVLAVPLDEEFSDVVRRDESNLDENGFLADLDMGGFVTDNIGTAFARNGEFETAQTDTLSIVGIENGRKTRNNIDNLSATKTTFQSADGTAALTVTRGVLTAASVTAKTISRFGDTGNFVSRAAAVYDFSMTAGRTGFSGPPRWNVRGNVVSDKINFSVDSLEIASFINASRGQDVYISPDTLEYNTRSGIEVDNLAISNITLRDQTSDALLDGASGRVIIDVRPADTSMLPDALLTTLDNGELKILARPAAAESNTVDCRSIIAGLGKSYNQRSVSQYLICQYVYWQRLEHRIDIKKCMMDGRSGCK
ncbi:MAG: hypothetical protein K2L95_03375 [Alphaproteobacteria bacterium]|nr:hypothetical protein [Alphaproteobacteria bacterium]MDE6571227.1 hypothetical protein [Alphaproteobacteria bacterium]